MKHTHVVPRGTNTSLCGIFDAYIPGWKQKATCKTCRKINRKRKGRAK
jgi:hypothetical protein